MTDKRALEFALHFEALPPEIKSVMLRVITAMGMPGVEFSQSEIAQMCAAARALNVGAVDRILRSKIVRLVREGAAHA